MSDQANLALVAGFAYSSLVGVLEEASEEAGRPRPCPANPTRSAVDAIITPYECTIVEWFEDGVYLDGDLFLDMPSVYPSGPVFLPRDRLRAERMRAAGVFWFWRLAILEEAYASAISSSRGRAAASTRSGRRPP